jgi:fructose-1,6-bisphosphatase I/sedoheptulose-1,7-bisphosphatase
MSTPCRTTLTQFLIEERRRFPHASGDFNSLILQVALACKNIGRQVAFGAGALAVPTPAAPSTCRAKTQKRWT